jgi:predicted nucleic acid-binding protein
MSGFLLDTNLVSEFAKPKPDPKVFSWFQRADQTLCYLSVLTIGEIRKGIAVLPDAKRRVTIEAWLEKDLNACFEGRILPVSEDIANRWGTLTGQAHLKGKLIPVIDDLIAATAIHHNLTLVTRNTKDIDGTGIGVFNPWQSD